MSIEQGILDLVKKNLPESTAGELKVFINEAEQTKKDLARAQKQIEDLTKSLSASQEKIKELDSKIRNQNEVDLQAAKTKEMFELTKEMQYKMDLTIANERNSMIQNQLHNFNHLMEIVFRNPTTTTNQNKSEFYSSEYQNGQNVTRKTGEGITTTSQYSK